MQLQAEESSKTSLTAPNQFTGNAILNKAWYNNQHKR
jgi:hypothetical protein